MTNATDALRPPFMQRCYTCGRESPAGPLLHYPGCLVGAGTQAYLDAVATNGCKVATERTTPTGSAEVAALQAEVAQLQAALAEARMVGREYNDLILHMNAGGDFHEFMAAKGGDAALHQRKETT